jgi:hypothetical protein
MQKYSFNMSVDQKLSDEKEVLRELQSRLKKEDFAAQILEIFDDRLRVQLELNGPEGKVDSEIRTIVATALGLAMADAAVKKILGGFNKK